MTIEEKIFLTILFIVFAIAVNFTKHMKGTNTDSNFLTHGSISFFLNKDGTEKWFMKPFYTLFFLLWIPIFWIFG
jgi:hypothetical protein